MNRSFSTMAKYWLFSILFFLFITAAHAQVITGKVADENGKPMAGVSVSEKGTAKGVTSKNDGSYSINVSSARATLIFSFVGYAGKEVSAATASGTNIVLSIDESKKLEQVVVVGYGTQKRKDLTGAIGSLGSKEIEKIPTNSVDKALQGQALRM